MKKPEVGQTLYSLNVGNAARRRPQILTPVVVTKVGRKYFTCKPEVGNKWQEVQYHLDGWYEKTDCIPDSVLYINPQEWEDVNETNRICNMIGNAFRYGHNKSKLSLQQLRAIEQVIVEGDRDEKS